MSDKRSRHASDAKSHQSRRSSYHTRSEASFSTASSGLSEARRRAALSQLQAEQAQRAAAAKAELARRLAEADAEQARRQAEQARQQAEAQAEQSRRQAEQAEAQAALEAQAAKDEAECRQLELELLEQEERGSQHPRSSAAPSVAGLPVVATEPPALVDVSRQTDESTTRTRQWLAQSQLHVPPVDTAPVGTLPPPAVRLQHPSRDDTRAVPHLPRITLEKFGGSAIEWPRWIALFKALVHDRADLTDVERLTYLQTHLTGPARESVRGMLCDASLYSTALCELEREFGDPSRVIHATMKRLLTARAVKDGDLSALTELSRELHTAVSVLQCLHYEHDLAAATNVTTVTGKLPASLAWRWGEHMVENGITRPTLVDLDEWLRRHVSAGRLALNVTTKQPPKVEANDAECRPRRVFTTTSARPTPAAVKRGRTAAIKPSADGNSAGCAMCQQTHQLQRCDKFLALTVSERAEFVGRNRLCFNCLGRDHISATCPSDARCDAEHCSRRHHALLHNGRRVFPRSDNAGGTPSSTKHVGTASVEPRGHILLQVVPITVNGPAGSRTTNALLDLGSQVTLVTDGLCDRLGISGPAGKVLLSTLNGNQTMQSRRVSFAVEAVGGDGKAHCIQNAQTTPTLNVSAKVMDCTVAKEEWPHLADLDLPSATRDPVEVLLGTDAIELIVPREVIEGPPGTPCAVKTVLGWSVTGRVPGRSMYEQGEHAVHHVRVSDERSALIELQNQVKLFWTTEAFGTKYEGAQLHSKADQRAMSILESVTRKTGDRYETGLLWRDDEVQLPDNRQTALTRLKAVERRLDRDPDLCRSYRDTMNDYITQGHASKVSGEQRTHGRTWYLPHHAVQNPNKPGKVRVVFDAAARCGGTSLNDNLITGPNNLNSLTGVLMRFRQGRVPIASDVKQMFHQIAVRAEDRQAQQFLWRDMDMTKEPETYQMNVVIFGAKSSPSTATYVLRRCAEDGRDKHPRAADKIVSRFYMDDYLDSVDTEREGRELVNSLNSLLSAGGFHLTKWTSTSDVVLKDVAPEDKCEESRDLDLTGENRWMKTLGVHWCAQDDQFRFKVKKVDSGNTKRSILSITSAVFDPLGMLAPFIVRAKCLIQRIWLGGWDWDEAISDSELLVQWHSWQRELNDTDCVRVGRCYRPDDRAIVNCQLHVFGDASELAFGVVAYLRFELEDGTGYCSFVMSKVRVAPIKQLSIPRLELQAAVMAVRVADTIKAEHDMAINETVFWSDSSTVLHWINSESRRFNTFVANRIAEIQDASDVTQWRHVPGPLNPADICSRGCSVTELAPGGVWVQGPAFLRRRHQDWPAAPPRTTERPRDEETAEMRVIACATGGAEPAINPSRFSSWLRLLRVTAWVRRFAHNSRSRAAADRRTGPLTAEELREAERVWLLSTQAEQFGDEVAALQHGRRLPSNSGLHQLTPFLDSTGLLRVGGRLRHAQMDFEVKHQVILPARGDITRLIITDRHKKLAHSGAEHVLTHLRQQFWVICGRAAVKRYTRACMLCRKRSARPAPPLMGDLPAFRVGEPAPVFARVGVDFFGPLTVKKHRKREKRYGCLFTCLSTRAVHIELAHSLDTDSFIMAMRRMMARRGNVSLVCSDNGTNFRAGERELRQALQQWNQTKIADTLSQEGVEWRFNPPGAPHFGGVFERLVRSAKRALTTVLGDRAVDDETLRTVVTEVEGLLNGRPLTYISTDPGDYQPLTPNHFLIGRASPQLPPGVFVDGDLCGRRRWKHTQVLIDHIWRRWRREYLPTLTTRVKWRADTADVQLGELVLVTDDNLPRGHWPVGRVVNVFPGADGRVRVVEVATATGRYRRPVSRLCRLECDGDGQ
ncbi:uncharacterized protein LOC122390257 [Amphibalanus amphitrite]|uniref:uncharacterized protein LOC122390257 n=1 Tax=Amphibalanus amphitrite TaxID=1232801 RepID=UPI001C9116D9|nr:uncharacterized protein LOC122390257 [Amphibalanus amphitrite]